MLKQISKPIPTSLPSWPHFTSAEMHAVTNVLSSGKINYWTGEECRLFEKEYAKSVGTHYAVALMNGSVALEAALYALDIGPGDHVITTSRTFIASASAIVLRGATPIFADVDLDSQNITAKSIEAVRTPQTKAIIVVHLAGWPAEMNDILALAKTYHLSVIEDCSQAHGAAYAGRQVGSLGDIGTFSFCQDKIITTGGEGGMITTNHEPLYKKIWSYKDHGKSYDAVYHRIHPPGFRWLHESFGTNWRMTEMQAAIGRFQLKQLSNWIHQRQMNAAILNDALARLKAVRLTIPPANIHHAYYKYYAFIKPDMLKPSCNRDQIMQAIHAQGIPCFAGSCSEIYNEKAFLNAHMQPAIPLPNAKQLGETSLMFLVHPTLTAKHMHDCASIIANVITEATLSIQS